jgi:hypothetical protein
VSGKRVFATPDDEQRHREFVASIPAWRRCLWAILDALDDTAGAAFRFIRGQPQRSFTYDELLQRLLAQQERGTDMLELDPDDEFEAAVIDIVKTYREKSKGYAIGGEPFFNFVEGARQRNTTPLRQGEALLAKHTTALSTWWAGEPLSTRNPIPSSFSDDAYTDRAVYSVILLCLYKRPWVVKEFE